MRHNASIPVKIRAILTSLAPFLKFIPPRGAVIGKTVAIGAAISYGIRTVRVGLKIRTVKVFFSRSNWKRRRFCFDSPFEFFKTSFFWATWCPFCMSTFSPKKTFFAKNRPKTWKIAKNRQQKNSCYNCFFFTLWARSPIKMFENCFVCDGLRSVKYKNFLKLYFILC